MALLDSINDFLSGVGKQYSDLAQSGNFGWQKKPKDVGRRPTFGSQEFEGDPVASNIVASQDFPFARAIFGGNFGNENPLLMNAIASAPQAQEEAQGHSDQRIRGRSPAMGSVNEPLPQAKPEKEFGGYRKPFSEAKHIEADLMTDDPEVQKYFKEEEGKGLSGLLGKIGPAIGGEAMDLYDKSITPDTTKLGILMKRAGLIDNIKDVAIAPLGLKEEFKKGLFQNAFKNAVDEQGNFKEPELIKNLSKSGFAPEAYELWNKRMQDSKKLALELQKIDAKKKEPGVQLTAEGLDDLRKKFPNAKIEFNGDGSVKKITQDPNANQRVKNQEASIIQRAQEKQALKGIPVAGAVAALGGGGGGGGGFPAGQGPVAQGIAQGGQPQGGGRSPATMGLPVSGRSLLEGAGGPEKSALVQGGTDYLPDDSFPVSSQPIEFREKDKDRALKNLHQNFKKKSNEVQGQNLLYKRVVDQIGKLVPTSDGSVKLDPKVKTGQFMGKLQEMFTSKDFEELSSTTAQLELASFPAGFSRSIDSASERAVLQRSVPSSKNNPITNRNIAMQKIVDNRIYSDFKGFTEDVIKKTASDANADQQFGSYLENNPYSVKTDSGIIVENPFNIPYKDYFRMAKQGGQPLPIDYSNLEGKYKPMKNPLLQDPNLEDKIKDDEQYITRGGLKSGAEIKEKIQRSKELQKGRK